MKGFDRGQSSLLLFFFSLILCLAFSGVSAATREELAQKINDGNTRYQKYAELLEKAKRLKQKERVEESTQAESSANEFLPEIEKLRKEAIEDAVALYKVPPFKPDVERVEYSPSRLADWMIGPWGKGILGNGAFQSSGWLGACLFALRTAFDHVSQWPYTMQDQQLVMALILHSVSLKASEFGLSEEETARLDALLKSHLEILDSLHREKFDFATGESGGQPPTHEKWPEVVSLNPVKPEKDLLFFTPPFLYSSDNFFTATIFSKEKTLTKIPVVVAREKERGFLITDVLQTNNHGSVEIPVDSSAHALLVFPNVQDGPFPHRLPIISTSVAASPPHVSGVPEVAEIRSVQMISGENLAVQDDETVVKLGDEHLHLLASSPSLLMAEIPRKLPGLRKLTVEHSGWNYSTDLPLAALQAKLSNSTPRRGEKVELVLTEYGVPKTKAFVYLDGVHLLFENGTQEKILDLEEKKPTTVFLQALAPGRFKIGYGIYRETFNQAAMKLESMRDTLQTEKCKNFLDQAIWALKLGELNRFESLLEELRYETLLRENKALNVDEVLMQLHYAASEMPRALARGHKRASSPAPLSCFSARRKWRGY